MSSRAIPGSSLFYDPRYLIRSLRVAVHRPFHKTASGESLPSQCSILPNLLLVRNVGLRSSVSC